MATTLLSLVGLMKMEDVGNARRGEVPVRTGSAGACASCARTSMHLGHDAALLSNVQLVPPRHVPQADFAVFDEVNRAKWMSELSSRPAFIDWVASAPLLVSIFSWVADSSANGSGNERYRA